MDSATIKTLPTSDLYSRLAPIVIESGDERSTFKNWAHTFGCKPLTGLSTSPIHIEAYSTSFLLVLTLPILGGGVWFQSFCLRRKRNAR
jgi:hypothetical protein